MCGFFVIVYKDKNKQLGKVLTKAGERLSYRGYDSTGIAVFNNNKIIVKKDKGNVEEVSKKLHFDKYEGKIGIIQLRWATYGKPSKKNSQPHIDCTGNYVSAHNGNIINVHSLFQRLIKNGHNMKSENDGEVIVHILEDYVSKRHTIKKAIKRSYNDIKGDYAYCFASKFSDKVYAVKKGSSLFAGIGKDFICVSSDLYAVLDHTNNILILNDGEMIEFDYKNYKLTDIYSGKTIKRTYKKSKTIPADVYKEPYDSFMEKEIMEVPIKLELLREYYTSSNEFKKLKRMLKSKNLIISGSGSSYNAALMGTYFLNRIARMNVGIFLPSDINDRLKYIHNGNADLLVVSQSGETKDIKNAIDSFKTYSNGKIIGMINNLASTIGIMSDFVLPTISDMEISVPATKTFMNQIALFYMMSLYFSDVSENIINNKMKKLIKLLRVLKTEHKKDIKKMVNILKKHNRAHILGYSLTYPVAMEGALKMKEVNYINIESMHSSEFKHGPLALITKNYPVIFISAKNDKHYTLSHMNEIITRRGKVLCITQKDNEFDKNSYINISINTDDENIFTMASVYLLQLIALEIAYDLNINPDKPRNISKTITVD